MPSIYVIIYSNTYIFYEGRWRMQKDDNTLYDPWVGRAN
jgi:hypothetical protein